MKFKTLRHKELPEVFGQFIEIVDEDTKELQWEIGYYSIPDLKPMTATMELCLTYWNRIPNAKKIPDFLKNYNLVEVEVKIIE